MADNEKPTYKITIIVERSDLPGALAKSVLGEIPAYDAEAPGYFLRPMIEIYKLYVLGEGSEQPSES